MARPWGPRQSMERKGGEGGGLTCKERGHSILNRRHICPKPHQRWASWWLVSEKKAKKEEPTAPALERLRLRAGSARPCPGPCPSGSSPSGQRSPSSQGRPALPGQGCGAAINRSLGAKMGEQGTNSQKVPRKGMGRCYGTHGPSAHALPRPSLPLRQWGAGLRSMPQPSIPLGAQPEGTALPRPARPYQAPQ